MTNEFNLNINIRSGRRTKPEVNVQYRGSSKQIMRIGNKTHTIESIATWIQDTISTALLRQAGSIND